MILLLLVLTIATKHGLADVYEMIPEDYTNYNRKDSAHKYTDDDTPEVDKIKYNELLSLLHNDHSNKALLAHINKGNNRTENVKETTTPNSAFEENTGEAREREGWNRLKKEDNITDKALPANNSNSIDIPKLALDSNQLKKVIENVHKAITKSEQNFNITEVATDKNISNVTDEATMKVDSNSTRPKRHTAIKVLRSLLHHTPESPQNKSVTPPLREAPNGKENSSFADLIGNLTNSIKILNERISNLKLHVNENVGFVMIKSPINAEGRRYLKHIEEEKNETRSQDENIRAKRDVAETSTEVNKNVTLERDITNSNVSKNDNSIIDGKDIIEPTMVTDLDIINKSKRDANISPIEPNNSTHDIANVAEKSNKINNSRQYDNSNIETTIDTKPNETNDSKHIDSESPNDTKDVKPIENSRKFLGDRDDILFFMEKEYTDIKKIITPMEVIRDKYSSTILYKIGYIIANLDTMEVTLKKLKNRVYKNKWETTRLEQVYKKLSMSRKLVKNVMRYLENYVENQLIYEQ